MRNPKEKFPPALADATVSYNGKPLTLHLDGVDLFLRKCELMDLPDIGAIDRELTEINQNLLNFYPDDFPAASLKISLQFLANLQDMFKNLFE